MVDFTKAHFNFGVSRTHQYTEFENDFDLDTDATSETLYVAKNPFTVEADGKPVSLRMAVVVMNMQEMSGETDDDGNTHCVCIAVLPDLDSMADEKKASYHDSCHLGDDEVLDYYDLYTCGAEVTPKRRTEACSAEDADDLAKFAAAVAKMLENKFVESDLDNPVNLAGKTGWDCVREWF